MAGYDPYNPDDPFSILGLGQQYNPYQGYPTKQVSDQVWDLIAPTPDYLIAQQFGAMTPWRDDFSTDAFFAADPMLRGPLAEALAESEGDSIAAYSMLQGEDMRERLLKEIGRTEWDQIASQGDLGMAGAITGEEKDQAALDFYMRGLEEVMAAGAPTSARNMQQYDFIAERMGGRPYPGAGGGYPEFSGPGFGGADAGMGGPMGGGMSDPLAALAGGGLGGDQGQPQAGGLSGTAADFTTPFGEGILDGGEVAGPDRIESMGAGGSQRSAIIGGRRYILPDTMAGPTGRSPAYRRALEEVMRQRRSRLAPQVEGSEGDRERGSARPGGFARATSSIDRGLGLGRLREMLRLPNMIGG